MSDRKISIIRTTDRLEVKAVLLLEGSGESTVQTGYPFLDHMLALFARHGAFDLELQCRGCEHDPGALMEETAICLGMAFDQAVGEKQDLVRTGHAYCPVDEHLARTVIDISGHSVLVYRMQASAPLPGGAAASAIERFWRAFAAHAHVNLHVELIYGESGLPAYEAVFKAAGRALSDACRARKLL